jgi:hypothetical protein
LNWIASFWFGTALLRSTSSVQAAEARSPVGSLPSRSPYQASP